MIKLFFMDVDGTLTDGKINMNPEGEEFKSFNVKDGYGIKEKLRANGITPIIISGRKSKTVEKRAEELKITDVYQGCQDKMTTFVEVLKEYGCDASEAAFIGDDIPDYSCMSICGFSGCPSDAVEEVKNISDYISVHKGGDGAVRDFIDWIVSRQDKMKEE